MSWAVCSSPTIIKDKPALKVSSGRDITPEDGLFSADGKVDNTQAFFLISVSHE